MKNFLIFITAIATLAACNQQKSNNDQTVQREKWTAEDAIFQQTIYEVYRNDNPISEGLLIMGVTKSFNENGNISYSIYTNFQKNYSNNYSLSTINYDEIEIPVILKYLDKCQTFNPDEIANAMQSMTYMGKSGYSLMYFKDADLGVCDPNNVRYTWGMSLTEIRNLFAGAQSRIQELKKADNK